MLSADLSQQLRHLLNSFLRYLVAGGAGFLIDYSVLALCYHVFGWHYLLAAALGFLLGLVFVYVASNAWVFESRKLRGQSFTEFFLFTVIGLVGLLLTTAFMWLFVEKATFPPLIAKLVTTALVLLWNFGARKFLLY